MYKNENRDIYTYVISKLCTSKIPMHCTTLDFL